MAMSKQEFLASLAKLYTVCNLSDSDSPQREHWTHPDMAGQAGAALIDKMLTEMAGAGVITHDEYASFYDNMI